MVPLYGDVQIGLVSYINMCPNLEKDKWNCLADNADDKMNAQYDILGRMDTIREEHVRFLSELARYNNEVRLGFCLFDFKITVGFVKLNVVQVA